MMGEVWEAHWKIIRDLDKSGAQGETFEVESVAVPPVRGVLKKLRKNKSEQARGRMHQEATNLAILGHAGVKVPRVLGGNTDLYTDGKTQLYFVMEYIDGNTLENEIKGRGVLSLEQSVAIALDVCGTIAAAHKQNVLHRNFWWRNELQCRNDDVD
jgi:serine/threonine-protein kinase